MKEVVRKRVQHMIFKSLEQYYLLNRIALNDAFEEEINLKKWNWQFQWKYETKTQNKKEEKVVTYENSDRLLKGRQKFLNSFESKIFPIEK